MLDLARDLTRIEPAELILRAMRGHGDPTSAVFHRRCELHQPEVRIGNLARPREPKLGL